VVRLWLKPWFPAVVWLSSLVLAACGQTDKGTATESRRHLDTPASTATLPQPELKIDAELDSDSYPGEPDNDNNHVFGHAADGATTRSVTKLVKRYYAAAAASDGAAACVLIYSPTAESIPEAYGGAPGSAAADESCGRVMSRLFEQFHGRLRIDSARLKVAAVRIMGSKGSVLLSFGERKPRHYLLLHRERGAWKVDALFANEQPIYVE
jgi:hypothetical protein